MTNKDLCAYAVRADKPSDTSAATAARRVRAAALASDATAAACDAVPCLGAQPSPRCTHPMSAHAALRGLRNARWVGLISASGGPMLLLTIRKGNVRDCV